MLGTRELSFNCILNVIMSNDAIHASARGRYNVTASVNVIREDTALQRFTHTLHSHECYAPQFHLDQ